MTTDTPELKSLTARREALGDRLHTLEGHVPTLVTSQTVKAKEFVARDDRGEIRVRREMREYAPCLTFCARAGQDRLKIGLRMDGSPAMPRPSR